MFYFNINSLKSKKLINRFYMSISVVIRSKNEERWIGHTIQSVMDFINKPEIIVIDNNSGDRTLDIVNRFKRDPKLQDKKKSNYTDIKIIKIDQYTPGKSLNKGVKLAKYKYILFISSHCVLKKFNLEKHIKDLGKHVAIFGDQTPVLDGKKIIKRYIWSHFIDKKVINMYSTMEERYFFHNALSMFKKNFLIKNKFDENLLGKEDRYWAADIIKRKKTILYDPNMAVDHHYTENGNTWKGLD